jgi:hypothetical protein
MPTIGPTRQDTYTIIVHIIAPGSDHVIDFGVWDKMTGGQVDSDETRYNPGAMGPPVSLGGRKTVENVTVSRLYRLQRDHDEAQRFINWAGRARMTVIKKPMDIEGNVYAASPPITYNGTLKRVQFPEVDSESSAAGLIELEMTVEGYPVA